MAIQPGVWGIDLGQCGLKAIRLQMVDGQITATAFDYVEHPKILSQPDADPDELTRQALTTFLERNNLRGDTVAISVPGQSGLARFVKLPPVEEKKISDIVRFEAKQQIPFNLEEVVWDYQKIGSGVVTDGFAMETEIGLFAMKRDMVSRYLQHFQDVGVEVHVVQMAPLALCNFVASDLLPKGEGEAAAEEKNCIVALDIGTDASNLVVTDGNRIIWQRPIPLGGNHFTRALTKDLKLTFAKAEHLKRNATKSPDLKKILAALKPVLNDFVGEVQRSLGYFTNTHRDAHIQYMVGLGNAFRLPGLQRFLSEKLQLEVRKLNKMERLDGDAVVSQQVFTENVLTFPVAYGLALQGLAQTRLTTNLLPPEIRTERLVRAKKPWAVAAAACLMLGAAALALSYGLELRTYGDSRVEDAIKGSGDVVKQVASAQTKFDRTRSDALAQEDAVKSIIAGQMERTHWSELLKFISNAVPRPDASNLSQKAKELYWTGAPDLRNHPRKRDALTGELAYKEWLGRIRSGPEAESEGLGRGIDDLIQVNVESISSAFCDNLGAFWKDVQGKINNEEGMVRPQSDMKKPPQGRGWIIEVRGYTFHHGKDIFLINTFGDNLARLAGPLKVVEKSPGPPGPGGPGGKPSFPAPGGPAGKQEEDKSKKPAAPEDLPDVVGHISHVALVATKVVDGEDTRSGEPIPSEVLALANTGGGSGKGGTPGGMMPPGGSPAPGGAMPTPGMPGMPGAGGAGAAPGGGKGEPAAPSGPPRSSWEPLSSGGARAGGAGDRAIGGRPTGGRPGTPSPFPGGTQGRRGDRGSGTSPTHPGMPGMPGRPGMPGPGDTGAPKGRRGEATRGRTEFVMVFVWKEETPSDELRGQMEEGPAGPSPSGGAPGGMPNMPPGMGMQGGSMPTPPGMGR